MSGHSVTTLNDSVLRRTLGCGGFAAPAAGVANASSKVRLKLLYTLLTKSRKGCTSGSRMPAAPGCRRYCLCRSRMILSAMTALSSSSFSSRCMLSFRSSGAKGLSTSVVGTRLRISKSTDRVLYVGDSVLKRSAAGTKYGDCSLLVPRRYVLKALTKCCRKFAYSDV